MIRSISYACLIALEDRVDLPIKRVYIDVVMRLKNASLTKLNWTHSSRRIFTAKMSRLTLPRQKMREISAFPNPINPKNQKKKLFFSKISHSTTRRSLRSRLRVLPRKSTFLRSRLNTHTEMERAVHQRDRIHVPHQYGTLYSSN